jgi:hypothetical protein
MMVVEGFQVHTIPIRQFMEQFGMVSHDFGENDLVRTTPPIVIGKLGRISPTAARTDPLYLSNVSLN